MLSGFLKLYWICQTHGRQQQHVNIYLDTGAPASIITRSTDRSWYTVSQS